MEKLKLDKEQIVNTLTFDSTIDSTTFAYIKKTYPIKQGHCPTCDGRGKYVWEGRTYICDCELQMLLQKHYFAANIGRKYHTLCFDDFTSEDRENVVPILDEYLSNIEYNLYNGIGITFDGPIGTGKSFAMAATLKTTIQLGYKAYFISFSDLINIVSQHWNNEEHARTLEKVKSVNFLGIDELKNDSRNENGYLSDIMETVVRFRTDNNLPTHITTNLDAKQQGDTFLKANSLLSEKNIRVTTNGVDVRSKVGLKVRKGAIENERKPIC